MSPVCIYRTPNQPIMEDHETFTHVVGVGRFMIAVAFIIDDGEDEPGPVNYECVCPNFGVAHAYVAARFNTDTMKARRIDADDPQSSYGLYFDGKEESTVTVFLELMRLEDGQ